MIKSWLDQTPHSISRRVPPGRNGVLRARFVCHWKVGPRWNRASRVQGITKQGGQIGIISEGSSMLPGGSGSRGSDPHKLPHSVKYRVDLSCQVCDDKDHHR
jgi:hypothetical protein